MRGPWTANVTTILWGERKVKQLMRYKITSGRVVEKRDVLMDRIRTRKPRGRRRAKSALRKIERNMRESVLNLARLINCNFQGGDLFVTLKYSDGRLPATREEAKKLAANFIKRLARAYRKATGKKLVWALVTADRSSKTGEPVRLHHHLVLNAMPWELLAANWPADEFSCRHLDDTGDYTAVARYMVKNAGYGRGEQCWTSARGPEVKRPVYSTPEPVKKAGAVRVPKEANIVEREVHESTESGFSAAYIRYILPKPGPEGPGAGHKAWEVRRDE